MAVSSSPSRADQGASNAARKQRQRRRSTPRLHAGMACETAFRVIARGCLEDLAVNHEATCEGGATALHEMRIALTRLRAAIAFFSPMAVDTERDWLKRELRWLNRRLGAARDMDVAIERLKQTRNRQPHTVANDRSWKESCADSHRELTRTLRSDRYRRLIKDTSDWIENGAWSAIADRHAAKRRAAEIAGYSLRKLTQWHEKLLKKSRRLEAMSTRKRHRLRLANKRLRYSIEFFAGLLPGRKSLQATLKQLRKAQESLGKLNDAANGQTLAAGLGQNTSIRSETSPLLDSKREKHLLRSATRAYLKMNKLKPLCA